MTDEEKIKELTLLLLYMTSWKEEAPGDSVCRTWKGYPFETLDTLEAEDMIYGSRRSKSVYLTEEGERKARELENKYFGSNVIPLRPR